MILQVENLDQYGLIKDIPSWDAILPLNAMTDAQNVAFRDGGARKQDGSILLKDLSLGDTEQATAILEFPGVVSPAGLIIPHLVGSTYKVHWVRQSDFNDLDVTRTSGGDYADGDFTGGPFHDGFVCTNRQFDIPQWMETGSAALIDLPNWPSTARCMHIGGFQDFMFAVNIKKSSTPYPNLVKWSHQASPGTYPSSWDETNPALDAGESTLDEESYGLVCSVPMGDMLIVYGTYTTWLAQLTGDSFIMSFRKLFDFGINFPYNVAVLPDGRHILTTSTGEVVVHNGSRAEFLGIGSIREFSRVSIPYFFYSRVVVRATRQEVWFVPNGTQALVWHWVTDRWDYTTDLGVYFVVGCNDPSGLSTKGARELWGVSQYLGKVYRLDDVYQRQGAAYTSYLKRENIAHLPGENGPAHAPSVVKLLTAIWPRLQSADSGATYTWYATGKMSPNDTGTTVSGTFIPSTGSKVDLYVPGRYFDIKFQDANASSEWILDGFGLDLSPIGGM